MEQGEIDKTKKAGEIHKKVVAFARDFIKPGMKLFDVAEAIDFKIGELGKEEIVEKRAKRVGSAFPVNLSKNEQAAHCTPKPGDEDVASGLLKVDIGVYVDGYVADGAFSLDLEDLDENKKLIEAAEAGLKAALEIVGVGVSLGEVGKGVQEAIKLSAISNGKDNSFVPIKNLTGHQIKQYDLHAGVNVPNYDSGQDTELGEGVYAIEPFVTNGLGRVRDGRPSGIYKIVKADANARDNFAREVLGYIDEEYVGLPFCARWIFKKFGSRGLLALRQLEQAGILHQYPQLIEEGKGKVAQAEHTVILTGKEKIVTTKA